MRTSAPTGSMSAAYSSSTTTPSARRLAAADAAGALPAVGGSAGPRDRARDRRRADRGRPRAALPRRETDDGFASDEGTFTICSFWLVSALAEMGELARARRPVREAAVARQSAGAIRRAIDALHRPSSGQLPAGIHTPGADQRRVHIIRAEDAQLHALNETELDRLGETEGTSIVPLHHTEREPLRIRMSWADVFVVFVVSHLRWATTSCRPSGRRCTNTAASDRDARTDVVRCSRTSRPIRSRSCRHDLALGRLHFGVFGVAALIAVPH